MLEVTRERNKCSIWGINLYLVREWIGRRTPHRTDIQIGIHKCEFSF